MPPITMLFVPADRPERFEKAAATNADAIVLDLEDAVAPDKKAQARANLTECAINPERIFIRINAPRTYDYDKDLAALAQSHFRNIIVSKAEEPSDLDDTIAAIGSGTRIVPLIETAVALDNARKLAMHDAVPFLAFGSIDFALDMGCEHTPEALLFARQRLVFQSRMAQKSPPIDGVTVAIDDVPQLRSDALRARELGFSGKLLIHPRQVDPVAEVFRPSDVDVAWAKSVLEAAANAEAGALRVNGQMVDRPVLVRAERILSRRRTANLG